MKFKIINILFTFLLLCNCKSSQCQIASDTTVTVKKDAKVTVKNQSPIFMPSVTDIDGHQYKTVKIGTQVWMAENLNVSHFRNGDLIPEVEDSLKWIEAGKEGEPAWCYNENKASNGSIYGKLYNWYAVNDPRGLAPKGYHVASDSEWTTLTNFLVEDWAALKMRSITRWQEVPGIENTNTSGFSALPSGSRIPDGAFDGMITYRTDWWSSTENKYYIKRAWFREIYLKETEVGRAFDEKLDGLAVRCVKDTAQKKMISNTTIISDSSKSETGAESGHLINNTSDKINKVIDNVLNGKIFKKKNKAPKQ